MQLANYQPGAEALKGRVILITGAGDGLGRAVALACAQVGATVVLLGRTVRKLEQVYDAIEQAGGPQPAIYPLNLEGAVPKDYADMATTLADNFGRLDGLVHNAALFEGLTPVANIKPENWYRLLQVNLSGPFLLTQAVLGVMSQSKDASIIFTTDSHAVAGNAYWGGYAVAKSGAQTMMKILAEELEENTPIRVNSIDPGPIRTRLRLTAYPATSSVDSEKWSEPAVVTTGFVYLLGADSRSISGQTLYAQDK